MIDCVWVEHTVSRRNYIHDAYSSGGFYKGGAMYSTFDANVDTPPQAGVISYGFMPGGQTGVDFANPDPAVRYESMYTVISNNIMVGQTRGAVPTVESAYCYIYNNLMKDCATGYSDYSYVTVIQTGGPRFDAYARHIYVFNNIFYAATGKYAALLAVPASGNAADRGFRDRKQQLLPSGRQPVDLPNAPGPHHRGRGHRRRSAPQHDRRRAHHLAGLGELLSAPVGRLLEQRCSRIRDPARPATCPVRP